MSTLRIEWVASNDGTHVERLVGKAQLLETIGTNIVQSSAAPLGASHARIRGLTGDSVFAFGKAPLVNKLMGLLLQAGDMETVRVSEGDVMVVADYATAVIPVDLPTIPNARVYLSTEGEEGDIVIVLPPAVEHEVRSIAPTTSPLKINADGHVVRARTMISAGLLTSSVLQTRGTEVIKTEIGFQVSEPLISFPDLPTEPTDFFVSGSPGAATIGQPYLFQPVVSGGTPPYTFNYVADSFGGLFSSVTTGMLAGSAVSVGAFANIRLTVEDSSSPKRKAVLPPFTLLVGDALGPSTATYPINRPSDELSVLDFVGLMNGERVESISPSNGRITIASGGYSLQRGLTASTEGTQTYTLTTNLKRSFSVTLTATSDEIAPQLTVPLAISIPEAQAWSLQLTTDDADAEVTLLPEGDAHFFTLSGGTLSLPALDFEAPQDDTLLGGPNTYYATILLKDRIGNSREQTIIVTVTDVAETGAPTNTVKPSITGQPVVGQQLSGDDGVWADRGSSTYLAAVAANGVGLYGLEKYNASYNGPSVRVQRLSDSVEMDIGFDGSHFDMATAVTFQGSSTLAIKSFYDQSGAGNHLPQPTAAARPTLWLGEGGPSIVSYQTAKPLLIPSSLSIQRDNCSIFMIGRTPSLGVTNAFFMFGDPSVPNMDFGLTTARTAGHFGAQPMVAGASSVSPAPNKGTSAIANLSILTLISRPTGMTVHRDGQVAQFPAAAAGTLNAGGQVGSGNNFTGRNDFKGFLVYPAALSDADVASVKASLKAIYKTVDPASKTFLVQGDSIIAGTGGNNNRTITAAMTERLTSSVIIRNLGIAGHQLAAHYQDWNSATTRSRFIVTGVENTYVGNYGHNDIKNGALDASTAVSIVETMKTQIKAMCADLRTAGFNKVIWQETLPDVATSWTAHMESARNSWNEFLNSNPVDANGVACFDAIDKVATDSTFPLSNAETAAGRGMKLQANSSDGVHPNESMAGARAAHLILTYNATASVTPAQPNVTISGAQSKAEGNSGETVFTYTVTRSSDNGAVVVPWSFAAGSTSADDFFGGSFPTGGNVNLADGVASGTFSIRVNGDTTVEGNETFMVSISAPTGYVAGAAMSATGTIVDDDANTTPVSAMKIEDVTESFSATDVTSLNVAMPATVNAGDVLIAIVASDGNSVVTWDQSTAGTWTANVNDQQTANRLLVFSKTADGTEDGKSLNMTVSNAQQMAVKVFRISGAQGAVTTAGTGARGSDAAPNPLAVSTAWTSTNNLFIVAACVDNAATVSAAPEGYGNLDTRVTSGSGQIGLATAYRFASVANEDPGPFTLPVNAPWICATVAVRPAA